MEHICEHLKAHAANSLDFRNLIKDPKMGKVCMAILAFDCRKTMQGNLL
jgi:hypothetical protein